MQMRGVSRTLLRCNKRWVSALLLCTTLVLFSHRIDGFTCSSSAIATRLASRGLAVGASTSDGPVKTVEEASELLALWDRNYNVDNKLFALPEDVLARRDELPHAVKLLNTMAQNERNQDSAKGRCLLGICASSTTEGLSTLKSWVTALELPRGILHGADKDGVMIEMEGVYIKYNSGGVLTFSDIRRAGLGLDAIWKPGDALLESYDGDYRGVYFQVELSDGEFRQYLLPLDLFQPKEEV